MAYVYKHIRKDNNQPFYIGVGGLITFDNYQRALAKNWKGLRSRSQFWHNYVNLYGFYSEILLDNCSAKEAFTKEVELIKTYGRLDLGTGILVNHTDGGEGTHSLSKENREKLAYWKGKKRSDIPKRQKTKRKRVAWNKGISHSDQSKLKMKEAAKYRKPQTIETKTKRSESLKGKSKSPEHIKNLGTKIIDVKTGSIYSTIKEAAIDNKINYGTLKSYLIGKAKNKTNLQYFR